MRDQQFSSDLHISIKKKPGVSHTVLVMLIMLPFSLWIFLPLFLLVIMMVFLTCNSLNNLNLAGVNNILRYTVYSTVILQL